MRDFGGWLRDFGKESEVTTVQERVEGVAPVLLPKKLINGQSQRDTISAPIADTGMIRHLQAVGRFTIMTTGDNTHDNDSY